MTQQVQIFEKKVRENQGKLDELADEFAANDEGDMELGDVHPYLMDAIKLLKIEFESAHMMTKFELSTFVKEFVDTFKQAKRLKNDSALVLPHDIVTSFTNFLSKNSSRITIFDDVVKTDQKGKQQQQQAAAPQKVGTVAAAQPQAAPQKVHTNVSPLDLKAPKPHAKVEPQVKKEEVEEEEGSEYEELEEEYEEEMEEELEEEDAAHFDSLHDILNEKSPRNKNLKQQEDKESP